MAVVVIPASKEMRIDGRSYEGCPIILAEGVIFFPASRWLASIWVSKSADTARSYARQLSAFLAFIAKRKLSWWDVTAEDVEALQASMLMEGYAPASINLLMQAVGTFYHWCVQRGYALAVPYVLRTSNSAAMRDRRPVIRGVNEPTRNPKYIGREQFDAVLAHIPRKANGLLLRDELMFECGRYMGLRRMEVVGLDVFVFASMRGEGPIELLELSAAITKRRKARIVPIPQTLVRRIKKYIRFYRAPLLQRMKERDRRRQESTRLFLADNGHPVTREYLSATWHVAACAAGVQARFHSNRHWFGTVVVAAATRAGHPNPLRAAADMMGHADIRTTAMYAHASAIAYMDDPKSVEIIQTAWSYDH